MKHSLTLFLIATAFWSAQAQATFPVNGVYDHREGSYAFTNATIHIRPGQTVENATLVIKDGKVVSVTPDGQAPTGTVIHDLEGKHIYPSFIDIYSDYGMPGPKAPGESPQRQPQMLSNKEGAYAWNEALRPETASYKHFVPDHKAAEELRKYGFGSVVTHTHDGMSRGSSVLVNLGDGHAHELILKERAANQLSFSKGTSTQSYPSSLMGGIALLRQTYLDADWYAKNGKDEELNISLEAWNSLQDLPQVFAVSDRLEVLRASKIGKEFGKQYIIKGRGDEYMRAEAIKATGSPLIIPLDFPEAYDVSDPFDAMQISLSDMKHWELAPGNAARLAEAGIPFAFTAEGLKDMGGYLENIRKAIEYGLSEKAAMEAMTTTPARLMKADNMVGTLESGKQANFIVTDKPIFEKDAKIHQNWVGGQGFVIVAFSEESPIKEGVYHLNIGNTPRQSLHIIWKDDKPHYKVVVDDSTKVDVKHSYENQILTLAFEQEGKKIRLSGTVDEPGATAGGKGYNTKGEWVDWRLSPTRAIPEKEEGKGKDEDKKEDGPQLGDVTYPFLPYGWVEKPSVRTTLIKNATLWTNEADGIMQGDILLSNGKISKVGKDLGDNADVVIDGTGKHVTSGIIDEHSHIAISRGVNEGTQNCSAEVSIADVVNSEDVNIYRNLSGGVTAAQLLHGSANPIGGQSGIVKLRWGFTPEEMKIRDAAPFIKFALGENVKQTNWGDDYTIRFPQSRMGVEQVYEDYFTRAREYGELKRSGKPYRKDLEMETLLQILESERFITCHSYVQSEINMLMNVAERHGFVLNTFTHILEGYKLADKMKQHGAGGSTFSDWWAYKYEVIDAIPYNAAILDKMGIVTALNSDDAEMSRRLNQEAGKAIMYGGMEEEAAWKLVTLNPAKLLHLDHRMGSLKAGKDADVVLWSDNPLSIYAKAEKTFVDGMLLYDQQQDLAHRRAIIAERNRLVQKMLGAKAAGAPTQAPSMKYQQHYHCDHIDDEMGTQQQHNHSHNH